MILSDIDIYQAIYEREFEISPADGKMFQPASIDVCLGDEVSVFHNSRYTHIDPTQKQEELTETMEISDEGFILHPGEFVLGCTLEKISLSSKLAGRIEGKSSLGRLGLMVHSTAGFIDPGFNGQLTLEISNVNRLPIILYPGMRIGQLSLMRLTSKTKRPYGSVNLGSHYQGQMGPTASRMGI